MSVVETDTVYSKLRRAYFDQWGYARFVFDAVAHLQQFTLAALNKNVSQRLESAARACKDDISVSRPPIMCISDVICELDRLASMQGLVEKTGSLECQFRATGRFINYYSVMAREFKELGWR